MDQNRISFALTESLQLVAQEMAQEDDISLGQLIRNLLSKEISRRRNARPPVRADEQFIAPLRARLAIDLAHGQSWNDIQARLIEAPLERRLTQALTGAGVTGFTVLPVLGGSGRSGQWSRERQVGRAGGMVAVVCLIRPDRLDALLDAAFAVVETHIGVVSVTDCQVLRAERF